MRRESSDSRDMPGYCEVDDVATTSRARAAVADVAVGGPTDSPDGGGRRVEEAIAGAAADGAEIRRDDGLIWRCGGRKLGGVVPLNPAFTGSAALGGDVGSAERASPPCARGVAHARRPSTSEARISSDGEIEYGETNFSATKCGSASHAG